jgi:hypothetical protein
MLTDRLFLPLPERPDVRPAPAGMDLLQSELLNGLPARLPLGNDLALVFAVPTGSYALWAALDPGLVVLDGAEESAPADAAAPITIAADTLPVRLYLMQGAALIASIPLRTGHRWLLPETGSPLIELVVIESLITAGAVRGLPMSGARLRLAWRPIGGVAGAPPLAEPLPPRLVRPAVRSRSAAQ